ncbi:hypothetical protein HQN64_16400 [Enterobacteriaceae bacterium BIT-l23]|uniref:immunity protein Tsi6 family protein n=1 Tax=Jejubacter sp. L23 TaxID=3092086 RepID=UPI0015849A85|nr:hypothetical protein [Enterobacteriaceae bacterium BIT-l23]
MSDLTKFEYVEQALKLAKKRYNKIKLTPSLGKLEPMYNSIVNQLVYLSNVLSGTESDRSKLWELTFGMYAAKELEASDEIFADRLMKAFYIADQTRNGLKVKLPHEVDTNYYKNEDRLKKLYPDDYGL